MFDQINLELKPSLVVSLIIALPCLCAAVLIGTRNMPLPLMILLICVIISVASYYICLLGLLRLKRSITHIQVSQNKLSIKRSNFVMESIITVHDNSFSAPWLCILMLIPTAPKKKYLTALICKHNVKHPDDFRRLRVWLKYGNAPTKQTIQF